MRVEVGGLLTGLERLEGRNGNPLYVLASLMAHNLLRELQMQVSRDAMAPGVHVLRCGSSSSRRDVPRPPSTPPPGNLLTLTIALVGHAATRFLEIPNAIGLRRRAM